MILAKPPADPRHRHTLELTDDDLCVLRAALEAYLEDFGHEEADIIRRVHEVAAKLPGRDESTTAF